ncbi:S24 family peptidase [Aliarcobacter cryaerophilus]|uniref:S24 family peptidase n=1 Tax=Aliarcobacter cryaerophilus TaxID=28198 RepID=UPI0021B6D4D6|nr:S24 family peptidase [Aliarcobacter cryaerophilus]MCT7487085.1 S24 family peptidase [Aliarcobacter cryaerophilus]MCT7491601.1 S24 family peptidase [Aliarcobacter cryaerophilus]
MYKLVNTKPVNDPDYKSSKLSIKDLEREIKEKYEKKNYFDWYTVLDYEMEPEILFGQKVKVFKDNYIFTQNDIYLVVTPDSVLVRRLKIINETVTLICSNKSCNNEKYLVDDINIIGKVSI